MTEEKGLKKSWLPSADGKAAGADREIGKGNAAPALSLWALLARSSIVKILVVLAIMVPAEVMLFYGPIRKDWEYYTEYRTLSAVVEGSHISAVFLAALGLVYFILAWTEGRMTAKSSGTMLRLRLSGSKIFWIKTAYNGACLAMLFAVQIWLCIWLVGIYGREAEEIYISPQRLFLAFYRIDFLHCLMPMAESAKWVRNGLLLLAFAMESAGGAERPEVKNYVPLILLYTATASWFVSNIGGNVIDGICMIMYAAVIAVNVQSVRKREKERGCSE